MKHLNLLGYLFLLLISCKTNTKDKFSFYPDYPDSSVLKKELIAKRIKENSRFNLPDITSGINDSLEVRVWPNYTFDWFKNCYVFRYSNNGFMGYHYNSYTTPIIDQDGLETNWTDRKQIGSNVFVVKQVIPKCGWKNFYDSVSYFRLTELPTQTDIPNFKYISILDGYAYTFEIATKNSYRILVYGNPHIYYYTECKAISGFIEMMKRQFGQDFDWSLYEFSENKKSRHF